MRIFVAGRGAGKTHELVRWVKEGERTPRYPGWSRILLTHSVNQSVYVREKWELDPHQIMSVQEWQARYRPAFASSRLEIGVDNAELILEHFLDTAISVAAMTGESADLPLRISRA
jgi:hypothetical protein